MTKQVLSDKDIRLSVEQMLSDLSNRFAREIYAYRPKVCMGLKMGQGISWILRLVAGKIRFEIRNENLSTYKGMEKYVLPSDLELAARQLLNSFSN